jgi:monoamine oxidase
MSRSDMMARLLRLARVAERCDQTGESPQEVLGQDTPGNEGRRNFSKGVLAATGAAAAWSATPAWAGLAKPPARELRPEPIQTRSSGNVAIVGAGLAGLACANELARLGVQAKVFEAADRVGGRVASLRDVFPGQVVERGGEFISASHHAMIGYARMLGLELERSRDFPGTAFYYFGGKSYSEAQVVAEYRGFAQSLRGDLDKLGNPTADRFSESDALFDYMSIDDLLTLHKAGPLLRGLVGSAYLAEFGAGIDQLSAISFMRFVYPDKRSKQAPFGLHANDTLRVVDGNDRITSGLAARLPSPVVLGHRLLAVRKLAGGALRLVFDAGGRTVQSDYQAVVMTLPFSVLRDVELHSSLKLPAWKTHAIDSAGMGDHSKLMVGFNSPFWFASHGRNGTGFSDRPYMQSTFEAGASRSNATRAVLAAHVGGTQARAMTAATLQSDARAFLGNLEKVLPGANTAAARDGAGNLRAYSENWSANPLSKGSHSNNRPGYFTTSAQNEAKAVGNLLFAGEHTSSFYEWQGFMEGAALSGLRAAAEVLGLARVVPVKDAVRPAAGVPVRGGAQRGGRVPAPIRAR